MNTLLLLGVGWTRDASLNPHFWLRAMVGGAALFVSLVLFDRIMTALLGAGKLVTGGTGGRRLRAVPRDFTGREATRPRNPRRTRRRNERHAPSVRSAS